MIMTKTRKELKELENTRAGLTRLIFAVFKSGVTDNDIEFFWGDKFIAYCEILKLDVDTTRQLYLKEIMVQK